MTRVQIYAGVVDTQGYDQRTLRQKTFRYLQEHYLHTSRWHKVLYYFASTELHAHARTKVSKQLNEQNKRSLFSNEEKNAFAHRCHLMDHYALHTHRPVSSSYRYVEFAGINNIANQYILGQKDLTETTQQITTFFHTNKEIQAFLQQHSMSVDHLATDVMHQIKVYRANIEFLHFLEQHPTTEQLHTQLQAFLSQYQEYPFVFKLLELHPQEYEQLCSLDTSKTDFLKQPVYSVHFRAVSPKQYAGMTRTSSIYTNIFARIGRVRNALPWYLKIFISLILFGGTAYLGGVALIILPLLVFFRQFCKTQADLMESFHYHIQRLVVDTKYYQERKSFGESYDSSSASWQQKKKYREWYRSVPSYIRKQSSTLASTTQRLVDSHYQDQESAYLLLNQIFHTEKSGIPCFRFAQPMDKEQEMLKVYKVLLSYGYYHELSRMSPQTYNTIETETIYQKYFDLYLKDIREAVLHYKKQSGRDAFLDGGMSAIIAGTTGWVSAYFFGTVAQASTVYATEQAKRVFLDVDGEHPVREVLQTNNISPDDINENIEETLSVIHDHEQYVVNDETILMTQQKVIDENIATTINDILPQDIRQQFFAHLRDGTTQDTLRDSLVSLAGIEKGNEYTQQLIDQLRKASNTNQLSEVFVRAQDNGLIPREMTGKERDGVDEVLQNIYNYDDYQEYAQRVDRQWIADQLVKMDKESIDVEEFANLYSHEQRSVLTHTAFTYIHKDDLADIFYDIQDSQAIGHIDTVDVTGTDISSGTQNPLTGSQEVVSKSGESLFNFTSTLKDIAKNGRDNFSSWIKSLPLSFGRNRIIPK